MEVSIAKLQTSILDMYILEDSDIFCFLRTF